jgi:ankyrin repeat protein
MSLIWMINRSTGATNPSNSQWWIAGVTPLHFAAYCSNLDAALILLDAGANASCQDAEGRTSLHFAACSNSPRMVPLLTRSGSTLDVRDSTLWTPLMTACAAGKLGMVTQLSENSTGLEDFDVAGRSAPHLAAGTSDPKLFIYLVDIGFDTTSKDDRGLTPLHYCLRNDNVAKLVSYVINRAFDLDCFT